MDSVQLRKVWDKFRTSKEHAWSKPVSLIVNNADDPTTMFNTAGMQPLVPYLMGKEHPTGSQRVYNIQGCVRTVDIEEVGDTSHLTYFEMMGNRSLGDYFKQESIDWSWEFLTDVLKLDPEMLSATIFEGDDDAPLDTESQALWSKHLPAHRITPLDKAENRRGPAGATGPCGPDSEIFYRVGAGTPPEDSHPGNDEHNRLEIRNNVFMGYYKDDAGKITEIDKKNVDTGMGFERILMVLKGQQLKKEGKIDAISSLSVYDIDIFQSLVSNLLLIAGEANIPEGLLDSYRIIADHFKTSLMLLNEGLSPSNDGRGYVLRRIIRRCYFHLKKILGDRGETHVKGSIAIIVDKLSKGLIEFYPQLTKEIAPGIKAISVDRVNLINEMRSFEETLVRGVKRIDELLSKHKGNIFSGSDAFLLYDTFGVPVELTQEIVATQGLTVDMDGYVAALETAKATSRAGAGDKFAKGINRADHIEGLPETKFIGYDMLECNEAKVLKDFVVGDERYIVFDCTPFYPEGGGQKGDSGTVELDDGKSVEIVDVMKYGGVFLHKVG